MQVKRTIWDNDRCVLIEIGKDYDEAFLVGIPRKEIFGEDDNAEGNVGDEQERQPKKLK